MSGLSGFRHKPGVRHLPRLGRTGRHPELVFVPRLPGRRRRAGSGDGRNASRECLGLGLTTTVSCNAAVRELPARLMPIRDCNALRPAARFHRAPPEGATMCGVQPHVSAGAERRPCRRPADNTLYAPSRGAGKAAASSRQALPLRRAGVVSTSKAGTDDAGNVTSCKVEVLDFRTNGRLTRLFSAVRKVATCLPRDLQMKRLTQRWNGALQGRQAYPHCGKTGSHSALPTSATASADMQIRAIFTYLTEVSGTHA